MTPNTITETMPGSALPKKKYPSNILVMVHMKSLLTRIDETKTMWPHMKRPSARPLALCTRSIRAGQRLLRGRSARPTPAMTSVLVRMSSLSPDPGSTILACHCSCLIAVNMACRLLAKLGHQDRHRALDPDDEPAPPAGR